MFDTVNTNIKQGQNGKIVMSKVIRTCTFNQSLQVGGSPKQIVGGKYFNEINVTTK